MKAYRLGTVTRTFVITLCVTLFSSGTLAADQNTTGGKMLIPGGVPFGVRLYSEGVLVVGVDDVECGGESISPAKNAGIKEKDMILSVNGERIIGADQVSALIDGCGGEPVEFEIRRGSEEFTLSVTPVISESDGKYRTGMWIRDSTAGIGTVTYIDPEYGAFAGLGHGICDIDSGELIPLTRGSVVNVEISGITKGRSGAPGELKGYFSSGKIGTLFGNKECGVYGIFAEYPKGASSEAVPAAARGEIVCGEAEMFCTVDGEGVKSYGVDISHIDHSGKSVKNFVVTVTDPVLLEKTGGIVQGMSGSPIIQDGKLVGAVTHVCVNL